MADAGPGGWVWPVAIVAGLVILSGVVVLRDAFVRFYEEPTLEEAYGEEYVVYTRNVPGWIPRLTPWSAAR